jgi:hypothetical protein
MNLFEGIGQGVVAKVFALVRKDLPAADIPDIGTGPRQKSIRRLQGLFVAYVHLLSFFQEPSEGETRQKQRS